MIIWRDLNQAMVMSMLRASDGDRSSRALIVIGFLLVLLVVTSVLSLTAGAVGITTSEVFRTLALELVGGETDQTSSLVVLGIRAPRTVLGILVGASLAVGGAVMQSLFRNPLADPGLVGVSSGAALAAVTVIVLGIPAPLIALGATEFSALPFAAFAGALITTFSLYIIATRSGRTSTATMLLAGIAIAALSGAATGVLVFIADDQQLRDLTFWSLGSLAGATWPRVSAILPFIIPGFITAGLMAHGLNGLLLGEAQAFQTGINVQRVKLLAIVMVALAVGASVAVSGVIGFVGIVVPHILRLVIGPDNRYLLPACALTGANLLLAADIVSRTIVAPAELPIGIVTAILGGPFFLYLLLRQKGLVDV